MCCEEIGHKLKKWTWVSSSNIKLSEVSVLCHYRNVKLHCYLSFLGEVTPGLSQVEYALRRHKLMSLIHKEAQEQSGTDHTVVLLSNPTYYMSNDIPYTFHQDNNFLYLCGFQEPDSILVLQSLPGKQLPAHKAMLFVPRRDPSRELWDGPRSGTDGAIALTGVDEAYTLEEFQHLVPKLKGNKQMGAEVRSQAGLGLRPSCPFVLHLLKLLAWQHFPWHCERI